MKRFGANDYGDVADLYDAYVRADFDLEFFCQRVARCGGHVLELMAGTGRVTRALYPTRDKLTSIDISIEMLRLLARGVREHLSSLNVVCADIRHLPFKSDLFELAIIPFNSFSELTRTEDQRAALAAIHNTLCSGGELICTLHNPLVRAQSLDDHVRSLGHFDLSGGRRLEVQVQGSVEGQTRIAESKQVLRTYNESGELVEERVQSVRFALLSRDEFERLARGEGYDIAELIGDYDGSPFDDESAFMIWTLRKSKGRSTDRFRSRRD